MCVKKIYIFFSLAGQDDGEKFYRRGVVCMKRLEFLNLDWCARARHKASSSKAASKAASTAARKAASKAARKAAS